MLPALTFRFGLQQARDRITRNRLTAPGFAYDPQHLPLFQGKVHILHQYALLSVLHGGNTQTAYFQDVTLFHFIAHFHGTKIDKIRLSIMTFFCKFVKRPTRNASFYFTQAIRSRHGKSQPTGFSTASSPKYESQRHNISSPVFRRGKIPDGHESRDRHNRYQAKRSRPKSPSGTYRITR